jgi:hypothetical protein
MSTIAALHIDTITNGAEPDIRSLTADLTTLQTLVGGPIEAVYGYRGTDATLAGQPRITFYLNEEGKLRGLAPNPLATALWWHYDPRAARADILVGPVLVTGYHPEGADTDIPEDVLDTYVALAHVYGGA